MLIRKFFHNIVIVFLFLSTICQAGNIPAFDLSNFSSTSVSLKELESAISGRIVKIDEFRFIREAADKMGVKAYLLGDTAAAYANYVKWDLSRVKGDKRFLPDRFDYDFTNIYRSVQDGNIVIDGTAQQAQELQQILIAKLSYFKEDKSIWNVRPLRFASGHQEALLNNANYLNQHSDTHAMSAIEITKPNAGESVIHDLKDWNSLESHFLKDVQSGKLHYYFSALHEETNQAKAGMNPPIISVIKYLTTAFQYDLAIDPEDETQIVQIIKNFNPKDIQNNDYVREWIEKNGKLLIKNSINLEYSVNFLKKVGLTEKLISINDNKKVVDSLAWWMNKEPLRTRPLGNPQEGQTAAKLFKKNDWNSDFVIAHETKTFASYEGVSWTYTGVPNALISRGETVGEGAVYGDGFYVKVGREGEGSDSGLTFRFHLNPNAIEGVDFTGSGDNLAIKNKAAISLIPENSQLTLFEYLKMLKDQQTIFGYFDKGILQKLEWRLNGKSSLISQEERQKVAALIKAEIGNTTSDVSPVLAEWFSFGLSAQYPEWVEDLLKKNNPALNQRIVWDILSQPHWVNHPEFVETLIKKDDAELNHVIIQKLLNSPYWTSHPELVEMLLKKENPRIDRDIAFYVLGQPYWANHPEWVERLLKYGKAEVIDKEVADNLIRSIGLPHWKDHPEWIEDVLKKGGNDAGLAQYVLNRSYWGNHPEWVESLLKKGDLNIDRALAKSVLGQPQWKDHPEWIESLLQKGDKELNSNLLQYSINQPTWVDHPEWVELFLKKDDRSIDRMIISNVLNQSCWSNHPEWVESLLKKNIQELDSLIIQTDLNLAHWANHPEWIEGLIKKDNQLLNHYIDSRVLSKSYWAKYPYLKDLLKGKHQTGESGVCTKIIKLFMK